MFYKPSCLDVAWMGYLDQNGFQLMMSYPDSAPTPIHPRIIPDEELIDIPSMYPLMDPNSKIWWENFIRDQSIIQPTNDEVTEGLSDFWSVSSGEIQIEMEQPIRILPRTPIHIANHPVVASEIIVGSLLALLPVATDPSLFWLAEVTEIDEIIFHVHYYKSKNNVWKKMSSKSKGYCGTTQIHGILAANFSLTKKGGMRKNVLKKIQDTLTNI